MQIRRVAAGFKYLQLLLLAAALGGCRQDVQTPTPMSVPVRGNHDASSVTAATADPPSRIVSPDVLDPQSQKLSGDQKHRPKTRSPISFLDSYEEALTKANDTHRRLLVLITQQEFCHWCRVLESETLNDGEVADLSRQFVCLKLELEGTNTVVADQLEFGAVPTSLILTAGGTKVDEISGYIAPAQYSDWLRAGLSKPEPAVELAPAPAVIGAADERADLLIWYVDRSREHWGEINLSTHSRLIEQLEKLGTHPQIRHLTRWQLSERWTNAKRDHREPDIMVIESLPLTMGWKLLEEGALQTAAGSNIADYAADEDYFGSTGTSAQRPLMLVKDSRNSVRARRIVNEIQALSTYSLPQRNLFVSGPRRDAATVIAERAAVGYLSGNTATLQAVTSKLNLPDDYLHPESWKLRLQVQSQLEAIYGNEHCAFAVVKCDVEGQSCGIRHVLVMLAPEDGQWKCLAITDRPDAFRETLRQYCDVQFSSTETEEPPIPRLVLPVDGATLADASAPLSWKFAAPPSRVVLQLCIKTCGDHPGSPQNTSLIALPSAAASSTPAEYQAKYMTWRILLFGKSGRFTTSERRSWKFAKAN